ncbi:MAG: inner membrane CreD family protein [Myxococcales bacterium]
MKSHLRLFGIGVVFTIATIAWLVLGGVTQLRKGTQTEKMRGSVQSLWGNMQTQAAPTLTFYYPVQEQVTRTETKHGVDVQVTELVTTTRERKVPLAASTIDVGLHSDLRRKGLTWHSLYDVVFAADYQYVHTGDETGELEIELSFPDATALYDNFRFTVDGVDRSAGLDPSGGKLRARVPVSPGQRLTIHAGYKSRGLDQWQYRPSEGVGRLEKFQLTMHTDFSEIDFPMGTMSPSEKVRDGQGYRLTWKFAQIVTGNAIGMTTPQRIQPGDLASELSLSAPISLFFYFFVIFVLATLRKIDLHPINYLLIAGAFFAFHLLFAYSVDHLPVEVAFALSSAVSVLLVVSYLRLAVSSRFAFVEAGIAQLVYLVGFSLAHFWDGFTGLTTTVLAIATLFLIMQLTGRIKWSEALANKPEGAQQVLA